MAETYSEKLCKEMHKNLDDKIQGHETWLKEHEVKIDILNKNDAVNTTTITNLCEQIKNLVVSIRWVIGLLVPTIISLLGLAFAIWRR
jgi:hypothetical protein